MENPCINCITLASCKARAVKQIDMFVMWVGYYCPYYVQYTTDENDEILWDKVNELGDLFGYKIEDENSG